MYLQHVLLTSLDGREGELEAALLEVRQRVFMSPGFRGFSVAQGAENPAAYLVRTRWETLEELVEHGTSGRMERCWAPVQPFLARPPVVDHFVERENLGMYGPGVITWTGIVGGGS